jgi:hypothetical protein
MIVGENVPRALTAAGVLAVLAAGAWLVPVDAQQPTTRERVRDEQVQDLKDTARKLEQMRAELDRQRQALDEQRRALEAQTKALHRAMQRLDAAPARKLPPDTVSDPRVRNDPRTKRADIEVEYKDLIKKVVGQVGKKGEDIKVIVIHQGDHQIPAHHPDLGRRLDHVQQALMEALQEIRNLRREMGHGQPHGWGPASQPETRPQGSFAPSAVPPPALNPAPAYPAAPPAPALPTPAPQQTPPATP